MTEAEKWLEIHHINLCGHTSHRAICQMVKSSARWPAEILAGPALLCSDSFSQQDVQIPSEADVTLLEVFFCSIPAGAHQSNKRPFCLGWICCGHLNSSLTLLPSGFSLVQHYYQQLFFLPRHWGEKKKVLHKCDLGEMERRISLHHPYQPIN